MQPHTTRTNKLETNAQIEAPRGGEILYSAPLESESSESEIFIRSFQTQETSAKTITGRCRRGHLENKK